MAITQEYNFSPSVNIVRDKDRDINYIPTLNGQRAFEQIVEASNSGARAFTIIGAYGTGKSTFLWALAQAVQGETTFFDHFDYFLKGYSHYEIMDFVGEFSSLRKDFAYQLETNEDKVLEALSLHAKSLQNKGKGLIIRIDEFGKYLEFAAKNNPEADFYFLQSFAELVNDFSRNIILITTLHQDFTAYAYRLSDTQRKEWMKVKGRFKEIAFNVPAEQLLLIAAERLAKVGTERTYPNISELLKLIDQSKAFPLSDFFTQEIAVQLAPLEILSGSVLTLALQRYGQNDRSLFTFLDSDDYRGIYQYLQDGDTPFYSLPHVFDYLVYHYYTHITASFNPDYRGWKLILDSVERAEGLFEEGNLLVALDLIKIVGLLHIFGRKSLIIDQNFLIRYTDLALKRDSSEALRLLESFGILRYRQHSQRYILFEGTDVDIDGAIEEAASQVSQMKSLSQQLNKLFDFPVLMAKEHFLCTGTPRYFEFKLSDEPISLIPQGEIDGFVNLIFSTTCTAEAVQVASDTEEEAILYIYYKRTSEIEDSLLFIEQIQIAQKKHAGDRVALREFENLLNYHSSLLEKYVLDSLWQIDQSSISLYYRGRILGEEVRNWKQLNSFLSHVSQQVYHSSPHCLNEMANKSKLSSQISFARKSLVTRLIESAHVDNLGYPADLFPPDKTIYLSLILKNGFHRSINGQWTLSEPQSKTFRAVWAAFLDFLDSAKTAKRSLGDFVDVLSRRPFKIKKGLVDFLLPLFLLVKRESFAFYYQGTRFIPSLTIDTLELVIRKPTDYSIKTFHVEGVRLDVFNSYRELLSQATSDELSNKGFVDTIIPFLTFYKELPAYAKHTHKITKEAQRLRQTITKATDPEKSFFEDFPQAMGFSLAELSEDPDKLNVYFETLRSSIKEIQISYDFLIDRFIDFIQLQVLGLTEGQPYEQWKPLLQQRFKAVKTHLLPPQLKTFLMRVKSPLDDRKAWINSIAQSVLGKSLEDIQDFEEETLHIKFKEYVEELDNYCDIMENSEDGELEQTFKVEVTHIHSGSQSRIVKIHSQNLKDVSQKQEKIGELLTDDRNLNIFILTRMLEEQFKK